MPSRSYGTISQVRKKQRGGFQQTQNLLRPISLKGARTNDQTWPHCSNKNCHQDGVGEKKWQATDPLFTQEGFQKTIDKNGMGMYYGTPSEKKRFPIIPRNSLLELLIIGSLKWMTFQVSFYCSYLLSDTKKVGPLRLESNGCFQK